ncbi:unnamed protein product [Scytosiphon promiscuus]
MGGTDIAPSASGLVDAYNKGRSIAASQLAGAAELLLGPGALAGQNTKEHESDSSSGRNGAVNTFSSEFHNAVERGEVDVVSELLNTGADAVLLDGDGRSPLLLAIQGGHLPVVTVLLEFGASAPNRIPPNGPNGICALVRTAARKEHVGILEALIEYGADVESTDNGGSTALQHAAMLGRTASIDFLVERNADVDSTDLEGCTALHWAAMEGHGEAIVTLLRHGAEIDAADDAGRTPLHRACAVDDIHATEAAELLLLWGADETILDNDGRTAEYYAKREDENSGGYGVGGGKQRAQDSLLQLLRTSPADRAWCRHGLVILCKARLGPGAVGTVLDRLVTMEEEALFEKSWAAENDTEDAGADDLRYEERDHCVQHKGEKPVQTREEPRLEREETPQGPLDQPQTAVSSLLRDQDDAWIKPHQTWTMPQQHGEGQSGRWKEPMYQSASKTHQRRGEQGGSPDFSRMYTLGKKLGDGTFVETFGATKRGEGRGSQSSCIVKRSVRQGMPNGNEHGLKEEVRILRLLTHPSVVTVREVFSDSPDYFYVVLERLTGGPVFDHIIKKTCFRENDARDLCRVLVNCVQHCHDMGVVHRDLRPEHLLLTSRDDNATIKLTGFDFARSLPRDDHGGKRGKRGPLVSESYVTAEYAAPEVLRFVPHGTAVDMWSMGVIFYTLLGGYHPFHDERQPRLFRRIRDGSFVFHDELWDSTSDQAKDFVRRLLVVDPRKRMTAKQALEHPWMVDSGKDLAKNDLGFNLEQLRVFNATAKLRSAIKSVMATRRALST